MKKIIINIKYPYTRYNAIRSMISNIKSVFDDLTVEDDYERYNGSVWPRIDSILEDTEFYKRGDFHAKFGASYHWRINPSRELPESIDITSITGKPVGTITIN